jgi:cytochrome c biogenesis protein CcmG/thiol:disulfide interchange protein DsbE
VKRLLQAGAVAVLASLIGLLVWQLAHGSQGRAFASAVDRGDRPAAPQFALPRLDAPGKLSLAALRGRPVVVNFWASWCVGCKAEVDNLDALAAKWSPHVSFVGVDSQDFRSDARSFARRYDVRYPLVHEVGDDTQHRYGVNQLPETFVLDGRGHAVAHFAGAIASSDTVRQLEDALRRAGAGG